MGNEVKCHVTDESFWEVIEPPVIKGDEAFYEVRDERGKYVCVASQERADEIVTAVNTCRASSPSPLTTDQAKERAKEIVQAWHESDEKRCAECTSPFSHEELYSGIASELVAVAPSVGEAEFQARAELAALRKANEVF